MVMNLKCYKNIESDKIKFGNSMFGQTQMFLPSLISLCFQQNYQDTVKLSQSLFSYQFGLSKHSSSPRSSTPQWQKQKSALEKVSELQRIEATLGEVGVVRLNFTTFERDWLKPQVYRQQLASTWDARWKQTEHNIIHEQLALELQTRNREHNTIDTWSSSKAINQSPPCHHTPTSACW